MVSKKHQWHGQLLPLCFHNCRKHRWLYQPINPEQIHEFLDKVAQLVKEHSPKLKLPFYKNQLSPFILSLIKLKRQLYRDFQQNENPNLKRKFNKLNKDIQLLIGQYRSSKWCEVCSDINKKQGKNYWDTIKKNCPNTKRAAQFQQLLTMALSTKPTRKRHKSLKNTLKKHSKTTKMLTTTRGIFKV
jgi:hypothetical protein